MFFIWYGHTEWWTAVVVAWKELNWHMIKIWYLLEIESTALPPLSDPAGLRCLLGRRARCAGWSRLWPLCCRPHHHSPGPRRWCPRGDPPPGHYQPAGQESKMVKQVERQGDRKNSASERSKLILWNLNCDMSLERVASFFTEFTSEKRFEQKRRGSKRGQSIDKYFQEKDGETM